MKYCLFIISLFFSVAAAAQTDTLPRLNDSVVAKLRIKNFNPSFNIHVDSMLVYPLEINKNKSDYYWFLRKPPAGLTINKDNGLITTRINKSYFLSGQLKYNFEYPVGLTIQNLDDPTDRIDTSFTITFYNTEIIPSRVRPSVTNKLQADEGDTVRFKILCDNGSFPIEELAFVSNYNISSFKPINRCGDEFVWSIPFDFIKDYEKDKQKQLLLYFIGTTKFNVADTARIEVTVKENINYPLQVNEYNALRRDIEQYIYQLKSSFRIVDKKIKNTRTTRTAFEMSTASTALGGTIFGSMDNKDNQKFGKILPSIGVALVPVKEAAAPNSSYDQNTAMLIRSSIKRLEYLLADNRLIGERDPEILNKTRKLRTELTQTQIQLIDVPIAAEKLNKEELDSYFNSPKVQKKYSTRRK